MTVGQRMKKVRLFRGMTQKQLGIMAGLGAIFALPSMKAGFGLLKNRCLSK